MNPDMKSSPLVTIAIPTFNRAAYLVEAIESALAQTYCNIEVLISDNASTDDTSSAIRSMMEADTRVRSLAQTSNLGMVGNWNACLRAARGDYFMLLSDDDLLEPDAAELLVNGLLIGQSCVAYGPVAYIGQKTGTSALGAPELESGSDMVAAYSRGERIAYPSATLFRTEDARGCGGYPDIGNYCDFALLLLLLRNDRKVRFVDRPLARYRLHESAMSFADDAAISYLTLYDWLEREDSVPSEWVHMLQEHCRGGIHRWGWSQSLRGNDPGSSLAAEILGNMRRAGKYRFSLSLRHFPLIKPMGRALRNWRRT